MLNQGTRPDEMICLRKDDVNLERGTLSIRRGKSAAARRVLDLTGGSQGILARRMSGDSPWIFPSPRNMMRHIARLNGAHDRLCRKALGFGVSLSFVLYDFRHTFATRMSQAGIDLKTIADILGHNSLRIGIRYVHPTAEHKKATMLRYEVDQKARIQQEGRPN